MALIAPNLAALISKRGGDQQAGASLGVQNAANSLGQAGGPLLGGVLFIWQINAPYLFSGVVLLALALVIGWKALDTHAKPNSLDGGDDHDSKNGFRSGSPVT